MSSDTHTKYKNVTSLQMFLYSFFFQHCFFFVLPILIFLGTGCSSSLALCTTYNIIGESDIWPTYTLSKAQST